MFEPFRNLPLSWGELFKRTVKESIQDGVTGLAAQLAYYFFLALFPALLFLVALASFFPLEQLMDEITGALARFAPGDVLKIVQEQLTPHLQQRSRRPPDPRLRGDPLVHFAPRSPASSTR